MAKDKKEEPEAQEQPIEPKKKKFNLKWMIIILVIVMIIGAGTAAGLYFFLKTDAKKPAAAAQPAALSTWPMEAFIVNIADTNGERYLKLVVQLEVSDPLVIPELEQLKPRLRDSILDLLTPKTYKDLVDLSGKQRLREDIAGRINNSLSKGKVTKVYFTDFVIQ
jgi:flagellar protein FliL